MLAECRGFPRSPQCRSHAANTVYIVHHHALLHYATLLGLWPLCRQASAIHEWLAHAGILTRLFDSPASLRFGLPGVQQNWDRLETALRALPSEMLA